MNNLSELSPIYYQDQKIYEIFSNSQDKPELINNHLFPMMQDKTILDVGCGHGKYLNLLKTYAKEIVGIDQSFKQVKNIHESALVADAQYMPFIDSGFDIVFASWMLGVVDKPKRTNILNEMKRVLKSEGSIIFLENAPDSEFENLRNRNSFKDNRTKEYNDFLFSYGFKIEQIIKTYFQFESTEQAKFIFSTIWNNNLQMKINSSIIKQDVYILIYQKG